MHSFFKGWFTLLLLKLFLQLQWNYFHETPLVLQSSLLAEVVLQASEPEEGLYCA